MAVEILDPASGSFVLDTATGPTTATYSPNTSAKYAGDGDVDSYALYDNVSAVFGGNGFLDSNAGANQVILYDWLVTTENANARMYLGGVVDVITHGAKNAGAGVYIEVRPGRIKIGGVASGAKAQSPAGLATGTQYFCRLTYDPAATTIQLEIFTGSLGGTLWWDSGAVDLTGDDVAGGQPYFQAIDTTARAKGTALYDYTISNVDYGQVSASNIVTMATATLTLTGNVPQAVATELNFSALPTTVLILTGNAPQAVATELNFSALPTTVLTLTGNVPQVVATENHISLLASISLTLTGNVPQAISTAGKVSQLSTVVLSVAPNAPQIVVTELSPFPYHVFVEKQKQMKTLLTL